MSVQEFRDHEISRLERSSWATNTALRQALKAAGLRPPAQVVAECLDEGTGGRGSAGSRWERAERAVARLREHFASFRFADDVDYGLLAIPAIDRLDTRGATASSRTWLRTSSTPPWGRGPTSLTSTGSHWAGTAGRYWPASSASTGSQQEATRTSSQPPRSASRSTASTLAPS
mgnify:CR=1 FL=1